MEYTCRSRFLGGVECIEFLGDANAPVIIFCHGYGGDASHLTFFPEVCQFSHCRPTWIFPRGIESLSWGGGRAWFPLDEEVFQDLIRLPQSEASAKEKFERLFDIDFRKPRQALEALIDAVHRPRSEIIIGGFSQGAMMTTELMLHAHEPFLGALICSGAFLLHKEWDSLARSCPKTPFIQSHGTDDEIIPYFLGKELYRTLRQGLYGELITFSGGHEIPSIFLRNLQSTIMNWEQQR